MAFKLNSFYPKPYQQPEEHTHLLVTFFYYIKPSQNILQSKSKMAANNINHQTQTESSTQLNSSSTMYLCGACRHPVDWDTKGVLCENCDNWYHIACQAIPSANYSQLDHSSIIWTCTNCNSNNYSTTSPAMLPTDETATPSESTGSSLELSIDSLDDPKQPIHQSSPTKFKPRSSNQQLLRAVGLYVV